MMAGYRSDPGAFATPAERRFAFAAVAIALLTAFLALLDAGVFPSLSAWQDKFTTVGPVLWIFAGIMWLRAGQPQPDDRLRPRAARRWAIGYTILGFVITPLPLVSDLLLEIAR